ncbi:hypothetical protein GPL02_06560 [Clostridium sp. MCC334]|nr:hypothetical protein [Clostridium sp. MCC334]
MIKYNWVLCPVCGNNTRIKIPTFAKCFIIHHACSSGRPTTVCRAASRQL